METYGQSKYAYFLGKSRLKFGEKGRPKKYWLFLDSRKYATETNANSES